MPFANAMPNPAVLELKRYTLHAGQRETLIDLFDRELVETQEACGMMVIGQFRDAGEPEHFVWLRGFADMEARRTALEGFYGGPVWDAHKDAANMTMVSSDDVLLLRPAWPGAGFAAGDTARAPVGATDVPEAVWLATTHSVRPADEQTFAALFRDRASALLAEHGAELAAAFVTDHTENSFPRLPVRAEENVFVWFCRFADHGALDRYFLARDGSAAWAALASELDALSDRPAEESVLRPTARSLLA